MRGAWVNHTVGDGIYKEPRYFLAGIHGGQSWHYVNFQSDDVIIQLNIRAKSGVTAYWVLIYENRGLAKDFDKEKKERERKSLLAAFWPDNS